MPKMTTEQFLSHLGIVVDQEFKENQDNSLKYRVHANEIGVHYIQFKNSTDTEWRYHTASLSELLNNEITPLPKYTLTDDEKVIVRHIGNEYTRLFRGKNGYLYAIDESYEHLLPFVELFKFIKDEVSIDVLRKFL